MPTGSVLLDTRDLDEARERVGAAYCAHTLDVLRSPRSFHVVQREANMETVSVHHLEYGATVEVDPVPLADWVLVSSPLRGHLSVRSGSQVRRLAVGETVALDPVRKFTLRFEDDCQIRTFRFPRRLVEHVLGVDTVQFGLGGPGVASAATTWKTVSSLLAQHARDSGPARYPLLSAQLERMAVAALAETHPLRVDAPRGGRAGPAAIRRVTALIEAQPERPFSTAELASTAGLSPRALQEAFRRHFDTSPLGYLREVRLRRAHEDLLRGDRASTVAEIAHRWGFGNLGRFARLYAQRYGRRPSDVLRN